MQRRVETAVAVYAGLAAVAIAFAAGLGRPHLYAHPDPWLGLTLPAASALGLFAGIALAALGITSTRSLVRRTSWARRLMREFRSRLSPLRGREVAALAAASAISEELLFRGLLAPLLGVWLSSLLFGLAHVGAGRCFREWMAWAFIMGLLFGALFAATGSLLGPIVAHGAINYVNLRAILRSDPMDRAAPRLPV